MHTPGGSWSEANHTCFMETQAQRGQFPCGYEYDSEAEAWFKMHTPGGSWSEANHTCFMENAEFATPTTDAIKDAMRTLQRDYDVRLIHTGTNPTEGMDNTAEPRVDVYVSGLLESGELQKVSQYLTLPYICYKKAPEVLQLNECGTTDVEYKLDNCTNQCYKFHRSREDWWTAVRKCAIEGGHLAIINSIQEAQVIKEIFARNPANLIPGKCYKNNAFLGFFADAYLVWKTVQGKNLSEIGYDGWLPGEPNSAAGGEFCGSVGREGKLYDSVCSNPLPFICERNKHGCESIRVCEFQPQVATAWKLVRNLGSLKKKKNKVYT